MHVPNNSYELCTSSEQALDELCKKLWTSSVLEPHSSPGRSPGLSTSSVQALNELYTGAQIPHLDDPRALDELCTGGFCMLQQTWTLLQ